MNACYYIQSVRPAAAFQVDGAKLSGALTRNDYHVIIIVR